MARMRRRNRRRVSLAQRLGSALVAVGRELPQLLRLVGVVALAASLPVGLYYGYHGLLQAEYFEVSAITIEGNREVSRDEVLRIARLDAPTSIFVVDGERIAERLLEDPWIIEARVETELPRTVRIEVREREAVGAIYWDGVLLVDATGDVIAPGLRDDVAGPIITGIAPDTIAVNAEGVEVEGLVGNERVRTALAIAHHYESRGLSRYDSLDEVHYDELVGYSLLTDGHHMEIRLGHDRFGERLERLGDVFESLSGEPLRGRYVLLDGEGDLTRVAVGPSRPGRGAN